MYNKLPINILGDIQVGFAPAVAMEGVQVDGRRHFVSNPTKWQPAFKKMHEKRWFFRVPCNYSRMQLCSAYRLPSFRV